VIGFPYETKEAIYETLRFAVESDLDFASFFIATPLPGTRLLEIVKKEGLIENALNWADLDVFNATLNTKFFTVEEINSLQRNLYVSFLRKRILNGLQPRKFALRLRKVRSTEDILFLSRLLTRFLQIIKRK
jgi:radical SAM superfamily enzyme YgiQ (UPF0313 family)